MTEKEMENSSRIAATINFGLGAVQFLSGYLWLVEKANKGYEIVGSILIIILGIVNLEESMKEFRRCAALDRALDQAIKMYKK